jgi:hypothetical protein
LGTDEYLSLEIFPPRSSSYNPPHFTANHARKAQIKAQAEVKAISRSLLVWLRVEIIFNHCRSSKKNRKEDEH